MKKLKKCKNLVGGDCSYYIMLPYLVKLPNASIEEYETKMVNIDRCLLPEILDLWKLGIKTNENCCGHTKLPPTIGVNEEYVEKMEKLGYEHYYDKNPEWCHNNVFIAKTKTCYGEPDSVCKFADFIHEGNMNTENVYVYLSKIRKQY